MHGLIRLYHRGQVRLLKKFWAQGERDLVVSLIPNFNRALRESLPDSAARDHPHRPGRLSAAFLDRTSGTIFHLRNSQSRGAGAGHSATRTDACFQTSGMILRPKFYEPVTIDREEGRDSSASILKCPPVWCCSAAKVPA